MAKASWVSVSPLTGSGNKSVSVSSSSPHTGRTARSTTLTITAANVEDKTVTVNQAGKPAFVENTSDTATAAKGGQNVTISGTANSQKLTFTLGTGSLAVTLPEKYTANSLQTNNGANIQGDPGATSQYNWSIVINVPVNTSIDELTKQIIVTDENDNSDICTITQAAGDATLSVSTNSISLTWQGTAQSFNVTSNTNWTIS